MARNKLLSTLVLLPISKIYGLATSVRNLMFDLKLLKQREFPVPVIVVGNLAIGGTGKTPHVEYIVENLRHGYHMAVVSRGYMRSTKGFVMATPRSTPSEIGDEPYQIYRKFNCQVPVAVCEDRVKGISELLKIDPNIDLVLLDDAFQHRYVKPTVAIVLTEYSRPVFADKMLPYGRLRESKKALRRADIVVSSKCPQKVTPMDLKVFEENLKLIPWQTLCFSKFVYGKLMPLFPEVAPLAAPSLEWLTDQDKVLALAGIANPKPFVRYIKHFKAKVKVCLYADHHNFNRRDIESIKQRFLALKGRRNYIITTEKDAVRLINNPYFPAELKPYIYYLPIKVEFMRNDSEKFLDAIRKTIKEKARQGIFK